MSDDIPRNNPNGGGWDRWSQGVQDRMAETNKRLSEVDDKVNRHHTKMVIDVTTLQVKSAIIGTIAGVVAGGIMSLIVGVILWQLKSGNWFHFTPTPQPQDNTIGFTLPPRDETHDPLYKIFSEAKT